MILFYQDEDVLDHVAHCATRFSIDLHPIKVGIEDLPAYHYSDRLLAGCKATDIQTLERLPIPWREKGLSHYRRDLGGSGEEAYRHIISIWMSKIALVAEHATAVDPFGTPEFAWIDASVSRFNGRRENWNFGKASPSRGALLHYANRMRYRGDLLPINASCLIGEADTWARVSSIFSKTLAEHVDDPYAHDEETILGIVHATHPELFECIGLNYTGRREKLMGKPHALLRRIETWRRNLSKTSNGGEA